MARNKIIRFMVFGTVSDSEEAIFGYPDFRYDGNDFEVDLVADNHEEMDEYIDEIRNGMSLLTDVLDFDYEIIDISPNPY